MIRDQDYDSFCKAIGHLISCYPNAKPHEGTVDAYWHVLKECSWPAVRSAVIKAPANFRYMPNAGELLSLAKTSEKIQGILRKLDTKEPPALPPKRELEPGNQFEQMAMDFSLESRDLGLNPEKPTPKDIFDKRMERVMSALAKSSMKLKDKKERRTHNDSTSQQQTGQGEDDGAIDPKTTKREQTAF